MEKLVTEQDKESKPVKLNLVDEDELTKVIEQLDLEQQQKEFIKARWLKYVVWWDTRSKNAKGPYHRLRVTAAIAGVITSALVGANLGGVELGWPMFALRCRVAIDKEKSMIDVALLLRGCELKATYLQYPRQYVGSRFSLFLETKTQAISRSQL